MPTYRDLYDALNKALNDIQNILDDVRLQCEEIRYWGIKGAEGEENIPPQWVTKESDQNT